MKWHKVNKLYPRIGKKVLICIIDIHANTNEICVGKRIDETFFQCECYSHIKHVPQFWMKLPNNPNISYY